MSRWRKPARMLAGLFLIGSGACGGDSTSPSSPTVTGSRVVVSVTISAPGWIVREGQTAQLAAHAYASDGTEVRGRAFTWSSLDPAIAPVDPAGVVTGVTLGTARIVASVDGLADTLPVVVGMAWRWVAVGKFAPFSCALAADSRAFCWGDNQAGELGDGTNTSHSLPTPVAGGLTFQQLAAGANHACGITDAGLTYCWGSNAAGELGDGTFQAHTVPTLVASPLQFTSIDAGADFSCALTTAGRPYCWGNNEATQLGVPSSGSGDYRPSPVEVTTAPDFATIGVGISHACGITAQGAAWCWGWNEYDQLGNGLGTFASQPGPVQGGLAFAEIRPGYTATCARTPSSTAYCWGGTYGGRQPNRPDAMPTPVPGSLMIEDVAGGASGWCGLAATTGYCWASSTLVGQTATAPVAVPGQLAFAQIDAGYSNRCGVATDASTYCWGSNQAGALGIGTTTGSYSTPQLVHEP